MNYLHSIEPIQKVFYTQREPVLVRCSDWKYYVCKHSMHTPCNLLFNEYLASRFLEQWEIYALKPSFITIAPKHLPNNFISGKLQPASFKQTLIGYPYVRNQKDVNLFDNGFGLNRNESKKIKAPEMLIKIGLFDLWLGNDDRNWNNYNLLLESQKDGYCFIPIDHETIFNTNSLEHGIEIQTENDSIINTPLFNAVVSKKLIKSIFDDERNVRENFYLCIENCKNQLDIILEELPHDWNISIALKRDLILKNIFSPEWAGNVFRNFLIFLKQQL